MANSINHAQPPVRIKPRPSMAAKLDKNTVMMKARTWFRRESGANGFAMKDYASLSVLSNIRKLRRGSGSTFR